MCTTKIVFLSDSSIELGLKRIVFKFRPETESQTQSETE